MTDPLPSPVDLTSISDPHKQANEIYDTLAYCRLDGFSGRCGAVAQAINEILFKSQGVLVMAYNEPFMNRHASFIGHVAVKYRDRYWDSEGEVDFEDLLAWGMLDPHDLEYAERFGDGWNEAVALSAATKEMPGGIVIHDEYISVYEESKRKLHEALILKNDAPEGESKSNHAVLGDGYDLPFTPRRIEPSA